MAAIRPEEISAVIQKEIQAYQAELKMESVGVVLQVGDGIARVYGLENVMAAELVEFPGGVFGMALNLEEDSVGCVILGEDRYIKEGDIAKCTGRIVEVPVGPELLGRVVDALGRPIDGKGPIPAKVFNPVEARSKNVVERQPVNEPLMTGYKAIDGMVPIGRGQRELILGDRQTGKTALCLDTIINQKGAGVMCFYVAIGQKQSTVANVYDTLLKHGAMDYTTIVAATANDPAPLQYLSPYSGTAMGEYFRDKGGHALVIYDDLTKHAWAYRQISLLLRRPPGREAYPGDIFNCHSRLLERSAKLAKELGGGSLTSLPIIETQLQDISAYIPTNVISITDGQIYFEPDLFNAGVRPAVNVGLSVSRVGGNAQTKAMKVKKVAGNLRLQLASFRELAAFSQFASDLDKGTRDKLTRGERLVEILKQDQFEPMALEQQVAIIYAGNAGFLDDVPAKDVKRFEKEFHEFMKAKHPAVSEAIRQTKELSDETIKRLEGAIGEFKAMFAGKK